MGSTRQNAFTLIELAVVLAVLAVAATFIMPRIGTATLGRSRFRGSVNRLVAVARQAREQAACQHQVCVLRVDIDSGAYSVALAGKDEAATLQTPVGALRGQLPESAWFSSIRRPDLPDATSGTVDIRFGPDGWADPAELCIEGPDEVKKVVAVTPPCGFVELRDE